MALERAPHLHGVEPADAQVVIAQPQIRLLLDLREQRRQPVRRLGSRRHRLAQLARPVAAVQRFLNRGGELDVLGLRLPRVAGGAAEDPRRPHAGVEQPLEGLVALDQRAIHLGGGRQRHHAPTLRALPYCPLPGFEQAIPRRDAPRYRWSSGRNDCGYDGPM